jgi:hypothetical protein
LIDWKVGINVLRGHVSVCGGGTFGRELEVQGAFKSHKLKGFLGFKNTLLPPDLMIIFLLFLNFPNKINAP